MIQRIAMWSGPRNISTAMMRAFENRRDAVVIDEPLYGHYLATTDKAHPGAREVIQAQSTDWRVVTHGLIHDDPSPATVVYQKHMAHHLCGDMTLDWTTSLSHAFLLREPAAMLASLSRVLEVVELEDTGLAQQVSLHRLLRERGLSPPVVDSRDILSAPEAALRALCDALDVAFDPAMLTWPPGPRDSDGVWAPHWYASVEASTGFGPYVPFDGEVPERVRPLLDICQTLYDELAGYRLEF